MQCAHPSCTCETPGRDSVCSPSCRVSVTGRCDCGHIECDGIATPKTSHQSLAAFIDYDTFPTPVTYAQPIAV